MKSICSDIVTGCVTGCPVSYRDIRLRNRTPVKHPCGTYIYIIIINRQRHYICLIMTGKFQTPAGRARDTLHSLYNSFSLSKAFIKLVRLFPFEALLYPQRLTAYWYSCTAPFLRGIHCLLPIKLTRRIFHLFELVSFASCLNI